MNAPLEIVRSYSYASVPTIKRFSQSRAFIRGLMGPFGSGKSSVCVMELVQWPSRQQRQCVMIGRTGQQPANGTASRSRRVGH